MSESMSWYDAGAGVWRLTDQLYVSDGTQWLDVVECWIFDGNNWLRCFRELGSLDSVTATNPFADVLEVGWTYTVRTPSQWLMSFEFSFDSGTTWAYGFENTIPADDSNNPFQFDFDGVPGFSSLNSTDVRLSMRFVGVDQATGSPFAVAPPYPT